MKTTELLTHLSDLGIKLWVDEQGMGIKAPKGALTRELQELLKEHKEALLALLAGQSAPANEERDGPIPGAHAGGPAPLSFGQRRLWFLDQMESDSAVYNMPLAWTLKGELDVEALEAALLEIQRRHSVLRTRFGRVEGAPIQSIDAGAEPGTGFLERVRPNLNLGLTERREELRLELARRATVPFELSAGKLWRPTLFGIGDDEHVLMLLVHHIVFDGWSAKNLLGELSVLYADRCAGRAFSLADPKLQYIDYSIWENEHVKSEAFAEELSWWSEHLGKNVPLLELPTDHQRPAIQSFHGANLRLPLSRDLMQRLERLAAREGATLYMLLFAAYNVLLARHSGQTDIAVGTIVANRSREALQAMLGFFANTLVLRNRQNPESSFLSFLAGVKQRCLDAFEHQGMPFERLVEALRPARDLSRGPLFQTLFMTEDHTGRSQRMGAVQLELFELETKVARSELMLTVHSSGEASLWAEYNTEIFEPATIERLLAHYVHLLESIARDPGARLMDLEILPPDERAALLSANNATALDFPELPIHTQFEAQAARTPNAAALIDPALDGSGDRVTSYAELDAAANRLAHALQARGCRPDHLVGLCLSRSSSMVIAQLAIQKAGAAYVPLDPTYPIDRLDYMVKHSGLKLAISSSELRGQLPADLDCLFLDQQAEEIASQSAASPGLEVRATQRMYVIYTSGSTGRPKGVELEHRSVSNFLSSMAREPGMRAGESLLAVTTLSFDISVLETMLPLVLGGSLIVAPNEAIQDGQKLRALIERLGPELMQATPATWRLLLLSGLGRQPKLRIFSGGEALPRELADRLLPLCAELWNLYGPTETTIWSSVKRIEAGASLCSIGGPIANTQIYVLDEHRRPQPIGVPGELWIAGAGLARGYLHQDPLTAERFVPDPFIKGNRMYQTGDLARWLPGAELECLGRIDNQIKLRGFRIELDEIEAVLGDVPGVDQCVCVVREDTPGDQRLVAYWTGDGARAVSDSDLKHAAQAKLPAYMLPSAFVPSESLPHTPNGKIDRKALASSLPITSSTKAEYVAPRNELERRIAAVWSSVLGIERVPVNENFFDLGGHSLLLAEAHAKLQVQLADPDLSIVQLFQFPTIESLAAHGSAQEAEKKRASSSKHDARAKRRDFEMEDIAIVGMAGRFPGADDVEAFWQNIRNGVESIRHYTEEELIADGVDPKTVNDPAYVKCWGHLDDVDMFDAPFFDMTPREAEAMDPQIRLLLETSWQLMERAGIDPTRPSGPIGVFAGASINLYLWENVLTDPSIVESLGEIQVLLGNDKDFVSTSVAYKLDLKGPAITIQTACSTSLVATHLACQSVLRGESHIALCGGVSAPVRQKHGYMYKQGGTMSEDGHVRAFDEKADGMLGGYGVGMVALKLKRHAIAEGDTIHGIIKGSAINNDGSDKVSFTAPSVDGQSEVVSKALAIAGVDPASISYVECHGTGTPLGDPIEIKALTQAWREHTDEQGWCPIGSVKTNIGHLDIAAGISGLIKATCSLEQREIAPSLNFDKVNPALDIEHTPFYVNTELRPWETDRLPRRATVSSLGMGGTNAHMILEEAPELEPSSSSRQHQLLLFSARTPAALEQAMARFAEHLRAKPELDLADAALTLQAGRKGFKERCFVIVKDRAEALEVLAQPDQKRSGRGRVSRGGRSVAFLFSGQGAQYAGMTRGLYASEPSFKAAIDQCCALLEATLGRDLRALLYPPAGEEAAADESLTQTQFTQPALFVVEYALARLWMEWGLEPEGMLGHSIGEFVAAHLAGVFSLEDALQLVAARGALIASLPSGGQMMAVHLSEAELAPLIAKAKERLDLAAVNAPGLCVVSGPTLALEKLQAALSYQEISTRMLQTSHAFHSSMLDPLLADFQNVLAGMQLSAPTRPFVSCRTGKWIQDTEATDPAYWVGHMRDAVRFADGVDTVALEGDPILLEIGPGQTLSTLAALCKPQSGAAILSSTRHPKEETEDQLVLLRALGGLWAAGAEIDWAGFYTHERRRKIPLPTYPFERQRYYVEPSGATPRVSAAPEALDASGQAIYRPKSKTSDPEAWFYVPSWKQTGPPKLLAGAAQAETWLLFLDRAGLGEALAARVRESGARAVCVSPAGAYQALSDERFEIDVNSPEDHKRLIEALAAPPTHVLHLLALDEAADQDEALNRCFYSPMYLGQALHGLPSAEGLRLALISMDLEDVLGGAARSPLKSTLLGPSKALRFELQGAHSFSVDLLRLGSDAEARKAYTERLYNELRSTSKEARLAFHGPHRWALGSERVLLPGVDEVPQLKQGGTYLVTGGLGGLGLVFAEFLARSQKAKLVLSGRTQMPERDAWDAWLGEHGDGDATSRKILAVRQLEALGAEVLCAAADVADRAALQALIKAAKARFGSIDGVFHCAGVLGSGPLEIKTREEAARVLEPKLSGTQVLMELLGSESLELFLLCSSISSASNVLSGVDYCAANSYLDALASNAGLHPSTHVLSVCWDTWAEVGMATQGQVPEHLRAQHEASLALAIAPAEGVEALRRILASGLSHVYVSGLDLSRRDDLGELQRARAEALGSAQAAPEAGPAASSRRTLYARPVLSTEYVEARSGTEQQVATIWADLLGIEAVGIHDDFFELGGNSLVMMQLGVRLRAAFGVNLPIRQLFELPSVEALAEQLETIEAAAAMGDDSQAADSLDSTEDEDLEEFTL